VSPVQPADLGRAAKAWLDAADYERRELSVEERWAVQRLLDTAEQMKGPSLGQQLGASSSFSMNGVAFGGAPGDVFVASDGFKKIQNSSSRGQQWTTGPVEVPLLGKGTLLEAPGGGAGAFVTTPQVIPGVVETLFQPLSVESLLSAGQASGPTVRYLSEGTATSGAAGVAESAEKPQSTLGFDVDDEPIKKIATTIVTSDELLEDVPAIQSFVNGRLAFFVQREVERQLLRGTSGGNEVQGLLTGRGVPVYAGGTAVGDKTVQLFRAMNGVHGSAFVEREWVIMSPSDYAEIRLLTDSNGQYYGGGPFSGAYGGQGEAGVSGQLSSAATDSIWSKPVYVTSAVGPGTAVVGSRAAAQIWNRGALSVEATNSHSDLFTRDMIAIRAERRLGLTVYRSGAYCEVRLS
jgi:HK97 family phage major capsid protein